VALESTGKYFKPIKREKRKMERTIEAIYKNGVFKPLERVELKEGEHIKIRIEDITSIVNTAFGLLKGKDTLRALKETEDEWGIH